MNAKSKAQKVAQEAAQKARQEQSPNAANTSNRASQSGAKTGRSAEQFIEETSDQFGASIADQIMFKSVEKAIARLQNGNFSDRIDLYLSSFKKGFDDSLEESYLEIEQAIDPKFCLPSSKDSGNSPSKSQKNFNSQETPEEALEEIQEAWTVEAETLEMESATE